MTYPRGRAKVCPLFFLAGFIAGSVLRARHGISYLKTIK